MSDYHEIIMIALEKLETIVQHHLMPTPVLQQMVQHELYIGNLGSWQYRNQEIGLWHSLELTPPTYLIN